MKSFVAKRAAAMALIVAAAFMLPQTAVAQTQTSAWTAPDGAFTVVIPDTWRTLDQYMSGPNLLAIGPSPEVARRENRNLEVCSVEARQLNGRAFTQAEVNALMDNLLTQLPGELGATAVHATNSEMQGAVRVISLEFERPGQDGGPTRQMQRAFAVPAQTGLMHYQLGCGASGTAYGAADYDAMRGFMASLIVTPGTNQ